MKKRRTYTGLLVPAGIPTAIYEGYVDARGKMHYRFGWREPLYRSWRRWLWRAGWLAAKIAP